MFERFTDRARRAVVLAQEEARMLSHNYIGTEHLLLGLLHEEQGVAAQVLEETGVSLASVREQVLEIVGRGDSSLSGHIPFTRGAKKVLELAFREALQLGTDYIGTEHLLLGVLSEGDGAGLRILVKLGKNPHVLREAVVALAERQPARDGGRRRGLVAGEMSEMTEIGETGERAESGPSTPLAHRLPAAGFAQPRASGRLASPLVMREYGAGLGHALVHADDPVVPRQAELELLLATLARRERNNALIIGLSGSGKSALVRALRQELAQGRGPAVLSRAAVLRLEPPVLRVDAGRPATGEVPPVAFVEDLDVLLGVDESPSGYLVLALAALADAEQPFILTATPQVHEQVRSRLPTFAARFEPIELAEADSAHTRAVLEALRPTLQGFHEIAIEDSARRA